MSRSIACSKSLSTTLVACITALVPATANAAFPKGAIVLFDGTSINHFVSSTGKAIDWPVENGALVSRPNSRRSNNLVSRLHFRDAEIHLEFMLPSIGDGNSGVFIQGTYELQILNSAGKETLTAGDMGAIYGLHPPLVNAALGPGEWQILDIHFCAPRRDANGNIKSDGTITAWLNGRKIHDGVKVGEKTSAYNPYIYDTTPYMKKIRARQEITSTGPLLLQDHDNPVRFRNIWVKPLDHLAFEHVVTADHGAPQQEPNQ
jgi:Domain of Unknown Function (DUF1080)